MTTDGGSTGDTTWVAELQRQRPPRPVRSRLRRRRAERLRDHQRLGRRRPERSSPRLPGREPGPVPGPAVQRLRPPRRRWPVRSVVEEPAGLQERAAVRTSGPGGAHAAQRHVPHGRESARGEVHRRDRQTARAVADLHGTDLDFVASNHWQWPSLLLNRGSIYLAFGSRHPEEAIEFHGWVLCYDARTFEPLGVFCTSPNAVGAHD